MSRLSKGCERHSALGVAVVGVTAALLAGCSSDVSRFSDPFSNPFKESARFDSDRTATGTIVPAAPVRPVMSQPLSSPISSTPLAPVRSVPASHWGQTPLAAPPSYGTQSYSSAPSRPYASAPSRPYASAPHESYAASSAPGGNDVSTAHGVWSSHGGSQVTVGGGDSAATLATRYSIPLDVLLRVNGYSSSAQIHPGSRIVIPVYSTASAESHAVQPSRMASNEPMRFNAAPRSEEKLHFVVGPSGAHGKNKDERMAKADEKGHSSLLEHKAEIEQTLKKDKHGQLADAGKNAPAHKLPTQMQTADASGAGGAHHTGAVIEPLAHSKSSLDKTATGSLPPASEAVAANPAASSSSSASATAFRWPAHGRIINGFKVGANDGINIAVPEGTSVKAAEDGVVAYAGNELKGYGNLVLIRHPNGFVSAYADNGEIDVKRGQTVKRGQVIAKSGQSGNVSSPQLHFELRKGQTPVDPTSYLAGL